MRRISGRHVLSSLTLKGSSSTCSICTRIAIPCCRCRRPLEDTCMPCLHARLSLEFAETGLPEAHVCERATWHPKMCSSEITVHTFEAGGIRNN